jgi:hypothetical protein
LVFESKVFSPQGGKLMVLMNYYNFKNESELKSSLLEEGPREVIVINLLLFLF